MALNKLVFCTLSLVLTYLPNTSSFAADFAVQDNDDRYNLHVSGIVRPGDYQTLLGIIAGKRAFPASTYLSDLSGDATESMKIGELYREAKLSAFARDKCGTACLLWLAGAVSRNASAEFIASPEPQNQEAIRQYLLKMDVSPALVKGWLSSDSDATAEDVSIGLSEQPESYRAWLQTQCYTETAKQREDFRALQALGFLDVLQRMLTENPDRDDLRPIIAKYEKLAAGATDISPAYAETLRGQWELDRMCKIRVVNEVQQALLQKL